MKLINQQLQLLKRGDKISWKTVSGVARGTVIDVSVSYIVRLDSGKQVVVNERSLISSDYARNFICDFIIDKKQPEIDLTLF